MTSKEYNRKWAANKRANETSEERERRLQALRDYHRDHRVESRVREKKRMRKAFDDDPKGAWLRLALLAAKKRARDSGLPFALTKADIELPDVCPVFGTTLDYDRIGKGRRPYASPSIDRIKPALGYVKGNVRIVCYRANQLRSDATRDELRMLYEDVQRLDV